MELFVPGFEGERKRSTRPAMRVLTAGTARAYIHDLLPPRPLSGRPVTPDTPFILLILYQEIEKNITAVKNKPLGFVNDLPRIIYGFFDAYISISIFRLRKRGRARFRLQ